MVEQTNKIAGPNDGSEEEFFDACDDMETGKLESSNAYLHSESFKSLFPVECALQKLNTRAFPIFVFIFINFESSEHYIMTGKIPYIT